jgi:hypothetical protein
MDLLEAKSRIAKALVESIFRRARYTVSRFRSDEKPLRFGRESFTPDFLVQWEAEPRAAFPLEVKYRPFLEQYLAVERQRGDRSVFALARRQWPELRFILVTDRPQPGRSCFQVLAAGADDPADRFSTVDLSDLWELRIFRHNVEDHERLVQSIIELLSDM